MKITNLKRIFSLLLTLGLVGFLVTSCEREFIMEENQEDSSIIGNEQKLKQDYENYIKQHGEPVIEYMTLKELNAFNIENGLPIVTLEELGTTEEELATAQASIKNGLKPRNSCWYAYLGDMNNSGIVNQVDLELAHRVITGVNPPSQSSINFGFFSYYCEWRDYPPYTYYLSTNDKHLVNEMILGISDCCP